MSMVRYRRSFRGQQQGRRGCPSQETQEAQKAQEQKEEEETEGRQGQQLRVSSGF